MTATLLITATSRYVDEFFQWANLVPAVLFTFLCYMVWTKTYSRGVGFYWFGLVTVIFLVIANLFLAFAPRLLDLVMPFVRVSIDVWLAYGVWYLYRHEIQDETQLSLIEQKFSFLLEPTPIETKPFWFTRQFHLFSFGVFVLTLIMFGFYRTANRIAEADQILKAHADSTSRRFEKTENKVDSLVVKTDSLATRVDSGVVERQALKRWRDSLEIVSKKPGVDPKIAKELEVKIQQLNRKIKKLESAPVSVPPIKPIPSRTNLEKNWPRGAVILHPQPGIQATYQDTVFGRAPQRIDWEKGRWEDN